MGNNKVKSEKVKIDKNLHSLIYNNISIKIIKKYVS